MPIFFQQDIDVHTKLAVWKIGEDERFFLDSVPLQRSITHPHKRLQHLAGRYLLQYLFPDFPIRLIQIADTRKPFLKDEAYHFSISHCDEFAAVVVSRNKRVGVDIERCTEQAVRICNKFSTAEERAIMSFDDSDETTDDREMMTLIWSIKEAVFKWYGLGEVDFRQHIVIERSTRRPQSHFDTMVSFKKNEDRMLGLHSRVFDDVCLSYVVTDAIS